MGREIKFRAEFNGQSFDVRTIQPNEKHKYWYLENGYVMRKVTDHPKKNSRGYVAEHRLVMEGMLGRFLDVNECVHHIDEDRANNNHENLKLVDNHSHYEEHSPKRNANGQFVAQEPIFAEIKYRLFDKDNGITQFYSLRELISKTYRRAKFEFRGRFTGLKDKNGKEIYEGDILKGRYWEYGKERRFIGQVVYGGHKFVLKGVKQYYGANQDFNSLYEILGNIYENPELVGE